MFLTKRQVQNIVLGRKKGVEIIKKVYEKNMHFSRRVDVYFKIKNIKYKISYKQNLWGTINNVFDDQEAIVIKENVNSES